MLGVQNPHLLGVLNQQNRASHQCSVKSTANDEEPVGSALVLLCGPRGEQTDSCTKARCSSRLLPSRAREIQFTFTSMGPTRVRVSHYEQPKKVITCHHSFEKGTNHAFPISNHPLWVAIKTIGQINNHTSQFGQASSCSRTTSSTKQCPSGAARQIQMCAPEATVAY